MLRIRLRSHPPEHAARGVGIGMFAAMTPTIGIQIPIMIGMWLCVRRWFDFSLPIAIACTFITNVFTFVPIYYLFVVTGRFMLGQNDEVRSFDFFSSRLTTTVNDPSVEPIGMLTNMIQIFDAFGLPLMLGCLPWAISISIVSYIFVWRLVRHRS